MARKILIIFAFIIAIFPFLGFTETTDITVTTIFSLLIAITLLFSRRPKMIPNTALENKTGDMPSPFVQKMQPVQISHPEEKTIHPIPTNNIEINGIEFPSSNPIKPISTPSIPFDIPALPRKKIHVSHIAKVEEGGVETSSSTIPPISEVQPPARKPRRVSPKVLLAYEEQVQPADIPTAHNSQP